MFHAPSYTIEKKKKMDILEYLKRDKNFDPNESIQIQVVQLKEKLNDKNNFKTHDDWKRTSFVKEGEE